MSRIKWLSLSLVLILLSACDTSPPEDTSVSVSLAPSKTEVANGETVTLELTVSEGADRVTAVDFAVKGSAAFASDVLASEDGIYRAESAQLTANTTFVATAKDAEGKLLRTAETKITVSEIPGEPVEPLEPVAEDVTATTLAGIQVVGGTPTGLAVVTNKLVVENGTPAIKGTPVGGKVTLEPDGAFTFTPDAGASAGSFEYEVTSGAKSASGLVTINITPLPANTRIVKTMQELRSAISANVQTIIVNGTIACDDGRDCAVLKTGQKLMGRGVVAGVTLAGVAKLDVTSAQPEPTTRPSTCPESRVPVFTDCNNYIGIELAQDTMVEGLEVTGRDLFLAIRGRTSVLDKNPQPGFANITPSTIALKDVQLIGARPLSISLDSDTTGSFYDMTIDNLTVVGNNTPIGINAFRSLTFTNSTLNMSVTTDTRGLFMAAEGTAKIVVDNVDIISTVAGDGFVPMYVSTGTSSGLVEVIIKNCDFTYPGATPDQLLSARTLGFKYENYYPTTGRLAINTQESTNNTTEGNVAITHETENTQQNNDPAIFITGYVQGNKPNVFITR